MKVNISGVKEEIEKFRKGGHEPQAVRAHLELDASGILKLSEVNLIMVHGSSENKTDDSKSTIERKSFIKMQILLRKAERVLLML